MHDDLFWFFKQVGSFLWLLKLLTVEKLFKHLSFNTSWALLKWANYHNVLDRHLYLCSNSTGGYMLLLWGLYEQQRSHFFFIILISTNKHSPFSDDAYSVSKREGMSSLI